MNEQNTDTPNYQPSTNEGLTESQRMSLEAFLDSYASEVRDKPDSDVERRFIMGWLNARMRDKNDEIAALKAENETLKAPMVAVRFTQGENMYGNVYYLAELGKWGMELNTTKRDGWKFFLTVGTGDQKELSRTELDDLISLLLSSRIYTEQFKQEK